MDLPQPDSPTSPIVVPRFIVNEMSSTALTYPMTALKKEDFISAYKPIKGVGTGTLRVYLKYGKDGTPAITGIKRISKPGLRIYKKTDDIPKVYGGLGVAVISTSKGLMTDKEARDAKAGGEVICFAW